MLKKKLCLDIGSSAVRMIEITDSSDKLTLSGLAFKESQGEPLSDLVKGLVDEMKTTVKEVSISVAGQSVVMRFISFPKMSQNDLRGAIKFEAEKYIPFNIDDCIIDFQVLKKIENENKLEILLVAVKKDIVEERIKLASSAGLSVSVVEVDSFAIANSFRRNFSDISADKTVALLNMGAKFTNLSILRGETPCLFRDIAIGGKDFAAAGEGIKNTFAGLADEIRLSCSYYENQCGRNVDEFYLSGGSASVGGLPEYMQESFGVAPNLWNPLQFLDISPNIDKGKLESIKGSFAVAAGLALR